MSNMNWLIKDIRWTTGKLVECLRESLADKDLHRAGVIADEIENLAAELRDCEVEVEVEPEPEPEPDCLSLMGLLYRGGKNGKNCS